jgi:hypothetical protein
LLDKGILWYDYFYPILDRVLFMYLVQGKGGMVMKWELTTADQFIESQEYIDTAIVPLVKIGLGDQLKVALADSTLLNGVACIIEDKLTGRVMLFPIFSYTGMEEEVHFIANLNTYTRHLQKHGFKSVIFLTHRSFENPVKDQLGAEILTATRTSPDSPDVSGDQVTQFAQEMIPKIIAFWKKG